MEIGSSSSTDLYSPQASSDLHGGHVALPKSPPRPLQIFELSKTVVERLQKALTDCVVPSAKAISDISSTKNVIARAEGN